MQALFRTFTAGSKQRSTVYLSRAFKGGSVLKVRTEVRYDAQVRSMAGITYPKARRADVEEVLHGNQIPDPYRWMEDPDAEETKAFVDAQNIITKKCLEACQHREQIRQRLTKLWNFPKFSSLYKNGNYYYFMQNDGLQNQYVLWRSKELNGKPEVFLDPNLLSEDGTVSLAESAFSQDGKYYCYGLSEKGSDWATLYIKEVNTMQNLPEKLERFRYSSVAWTKDEKGFFYGQYPNFDDQVSGRIEAADNQKIFYHVVNTPQEKDILCVEFPTQSRWLSAPATSECGKYLVLSVSESCKDNQLYIADISAGISGILPLQCIYGKFDCQIQYITNCDNIFYFRTNKNRPNYAVIQLDINKPDEWTDLIPEHENDVLDWVICVDKDKLVVGYMKDVVSVVHIYQLRNGKFMQKLPFDIGTVNSPFCKRKESELFFIFETFTTPGIVYRCEVDKAPNATLEEYRRIQLNSATTDDLVVKQVFYQSKDNTKVPMFIVREKDAPMDATSPCLLYVYGGFNCAIQPYFSIFRLMLMKALGFTVAVANVRGGSEYGEKWHNAGRLKNKQNTLDDVHAAAEYLVRDGYTKASRLVLMGRSNGGMVTTACINQRPELYGAAVAQVPVTDLYRFHKFTIGKHWCSDYGNPDVASDFYIQSKYSPLHNVPSNIDYFPSLLVMTADHDDRVVPSHTLKYVAELQYQIGEKNKKPLLALIDTNSGHGSGKPTSKIIDELVDIMCFLHGELKLNYSE